jgi:hypothetical protein
MHIFSFRERFIGLPNPASGGLYAPVTLPAPRQSHQADYKVFKKTLEEKVEAMAVRAQHKRELIACFGAGNTNRRMNPTVAD